VTIFKNYRVKPNQTFLFCDCNFFIFFDKKNYLGNKMEILGNNNEILGNNFRILGNILRF
jgi:hypothetical protein